MEVRGVYFGEDDVVRRIGKVAVSDPANPFEIEFEDLPGQIDGKPVSVEAFALVLPRAQWTQPVSTLTDGASLAQLLDEVTIEYAQGSAQHKALGHRQLCSKLDGYRLLNVLTCLSDRAPFPALGTNRTIPTDVGTAATAANKAALLDAFATGQKVSGDHLHGLGPFHVATSGGTSAVDDRITVVFWIGKRAGHEDASFPVEAFKGSKGCKGADPGRIRILLGDQVDGVDVTWSAGGGTNEQCELYAIFRKCGEKQPLGQTLEIVTKPFTKETQVVPSGHLAFLGFAKRLVSGAMQAHVYTDVSLTVDGAPAIESRSTDHLRAVNLLHTLAGRGYGYTNNDATYTTATNAARRVNWCYPLVQAQPGASILRMLGSDRFGCVQVQVTGTSETSHELLCARYVVWTDEQRAAAVAAAQSGCGTAASVELGPNLRNGNKAASSALADAVPQVITRTVATAAMAAQKIPG